jgi:CrcB protein
VKKYIYLSIGGAAGAVSRYLIKLAGLGLSVAGQYSATLLINIAGCFAFAFLARVFIDALRIRPELKLGVTVGFFGAFTTFSAFSGEAAALIRLRHYPEALLYAAVSLFTGIAAIWFGSFLAVRFETTMSRRKQAE